MAIARTRSIAPSGDNDATPEHVKDLLAAKKRALREHGPGYDTWILDKIGIETMFANRVAMGAGLGPPKFRWVPYADAFLVTARERRNTSARAA